MKKVEEEREKEREKLREELKGKEMEARRIREEKERVERVRDRLMAIGRARKMGQGGDRDSLGGRESLVGRETFLLADDVGDYKKKEGLSVGEIVTRDKVEPVI